MAENTYKTKKWRSLFSYLERLTFLKHSLAEGLLLRYISWIGYALCLGLLYIGNTHYHEKMLRQIQGLEQEIAELRVVFTTLEASYMTECKQSAVAQCVAPLGLCETHRPPFVIKQRLR
ncbi:MAG: FtsL-like putative cell division protein [Bacteroidota bacterium]